MYCIALAQNKMEIQNGIWNWNCTVRTCFVALHPYLPCHGVYILLAGVIHWLSAVI